MLRVYSPFRKGCFAFTDVQHTVVFDKTGTLTFGTPQVTSVNAAEGASRGDLLAAAASAEFGSEHTLGKAIIEGARAEGVEIIQSGSFAYTPGRGIAATVAGEPVLVGSELWLREHGVEVIDVAAAANEAETRIFVGRAGRMLGVIGVADTVRAEAREAIAAIQHLESGRCCLRATTNGSATRSGAPLPSARSNRTFCRSKRSNAFDGLSSRDASSPWWVTA